MFKELASFLKTNPKFRFLPQNMEFAIWPCFEFEKINFFWGYISFQRPIKNKICDLICRKSLIFLAKTDFNQYAFPLRNFIAFPS